MALGARPTDVLRMVTAEGIELAILGVLFGVIASLGLGRLVASRLYGVTATDPLILASAVMLMLLVTAAACAVPALRAARIDPVRAPAERVAARVLASLKFVATGNVNVKTFDVNHSSGRSRIESRALRVGGGTLGGSSNFTRN
jgi:hypothetical protein